METKALENLTIKSNFVFGAVMRNPQKCKALLECILNIQIRRIEYPELEKTIDKTIQAKGVRLDVYVEDEANTIYNVELQATDKKNLPKRMRYYQGMIDLNVIDKGQDYKALKKSYVIFICDYDEFGYGRHIYTFENRCKEMPDLALGDNTIKVVLNTKGTADDVSNEVKALLHYIGGDSPSTELTKSLDEEVAKVKSSEEWRREYMTLFMRDRENIELGGFRTVVKQIRNQSAHMSVSEMSSMFLVPEEQVANILAAISQNPHMDDEEIAEMLID